MLKDPPVEETSYRTQVGRYILVRATEDRSEVERLYWIQENAQ